METEAEERLQSALDLILNDKLMEFQLKKSKSNFILYVSSIALEIFISVISFSVKLSDSTME